MINATVKDYFLNYNTSMVVSSVNSVSAIILTNPGRNGIEALFEWPFAQPDHTYTIEKGPLAIELDRHLITRPAGLLWKVDGNVAANRCIVDCFGDEFHQTLLEIHSEGGDTASMSELKFEKSQRIEIAKLQQNSPATPQKLARFLFAYLAENEHPIPNIDDFAY